MQLRLELHGTQKMPDHVQKAGGRRHYNYQYNDIKNTREVSRYRTLHQLSSRITQLINSVEIRRIDYIIMRIRKPRFGPSASSRHPYITTESALTETLSSRHYGPYQSRNVRRQRGQYGMSESRQIWWKNREHRTRKVSDDTQDNNDIRPRLASKLSGPDIVFIIHIA